MLASTMQHSTHNHTPTPRPPPHPPPGCVRRPKPGTAREPHHPHHGGPQVSSQDPTACRTPTTRTTRTAGHRSVGFAFHPANPPHTTRRTRQRTASWNQRKENQPRRHPTHPSVKQHQHEAGHPTNTMGLLRKEVIQPHLPVRLPCYDFVPIASPTFDNSLPQGVRPSASGVTNFRDVTGGVYKARERIHRSVADLRLLATPTSRGRVADPDPN
jgi:hypothetical protein